MASNRNIKGLPRGSTLKIASWNLDWYRPDPKARASAALAHLRLSFGEEPGHFVVMLQEVRRESLRAILEHAWVQRNFILSNVNPPESVYNDIPGSSFVIKEVKWEAERYFTLMMVSRTLPISNCFRIPFATAMGRDALVVDIPILKSGLSFSRDSLRLCTTHLDSTWYGKAYRPGQLAVISALLKGASAIGDRIIGGLVGGDMNAVDGSEHSYHRAAEVDLKDAWEDEPAPHIPVPKPLQKDTTYGRARGNTWGYQSSRSRERKRIDKFLYTGSLEIVAVNEA